MRIVQLHWAFPPTTGGVESHVSDVAGGLAARGLDVVVVTGESMPVTPAGVQVVTSELLDLTRIRSGLADDPDYHRALRQELGRLMRSLRPDVVHGHNLHHFAAGPALALDELRLRQGFSLHHTFHETWPDLLNETPVYRKWEGNYAVSQHVASECAARIGFRPTLRPLGIDIRRFRASRPVPSRISRPTILHPARLLPWKGVHVSVRMLGLLRDAGLDARLILTDTARIADWDRQLADYRAEVVELAHSLGLTDHIEMRSASYLDMPLLYEEADVVVYPTVADEPFGLVPLEAMSSGRPIVASRCGGIPETVVPGVTGWLVEPDDPRALADRVMEVIVQPGLARSIGAAGRRHVAEHFDLDDYLDGLLEAYRVASIAK